MGKPVSGVGVALLSVGGVLVYAGAKGISVLAAVQNAIKGQPIATNAGLIPLTTGEQGNAGAGNVTQSPSAAGDPKSLAKAQTAGYGWNTGAEWDALVQLWEHESSWNPKAENPSSGAYGIPQALPYTKMPQAAWPERYGGTSDAYTQIQWGLSYIKGRYGSPVMAWAFWQRNRWY